MHDTDIVQIIMIGHVEQQGNNVMVFNTNGAFMWNRFGTLVNYTSNTVIIKNGSTTFVCGENGQILSTH